MANKTLFKTSRVKNKPADTVNEAGGIAYKFEDKHALAQLVVTSCLNNTYYTTAEEQLEKILGLCQNVEPEFIAKAAVYARENGKMKDTPVLLTAVLCNRGDVGLALASRIFNRTINNVKALTVFCRIIRSGVTGRHNFGQGVRRLVNNWLASKSAAYLFNGQIGQSNPSLADVIKMTHPAPNDRYAEALFGYVIGRGYNEKNLPKNVRDFEAFKKDNSREVPDVPFRALTNCTLSESQWREIAREMPWNTLRMNLNMLTRKGVFNDKGFLRDVCSKLGNANEVIKSRVMPYQIMTAYQNIDSDVPGSIGVALHKAMEASTENVPEFRGDIALAIDV
jgi:60 kDa SS-A/Ro ribonucleoprotein